MAKHMQHHLSDYTVCPGETLWLGTRVLWISASNWGQVAALCDLRQQATWRSLGESNPSFQIENLAS